MGYGLYIHIPYCASKCAYCDFYSAATQGGVPDAYIDALLRDLARYAPGRRPETVYFGGGTPGLLTPGQAARLLDAASPAPGAEVTLETNPGLVTEEGLRGFLTAGVNRLSLGVQSARDESLRLLGRRHTAEEARAAFAIAGRAGFTNITGDIMLALPGYTRAELDATLALIQQGGASHISAYLLKLEPGTPLYKSPPPGLPDEDEAAEFYLYAVERLAEEGYAQYEISNFARPGFEGRHNLLYWDCRDVLGLGPAAHSLLAGERFSFPRDVGAFIEDRLPPVQEGALDAEDYIMLRLRLAEGLEEGELARRFGVALTEKQQAFMRGLTAPGYTQCTEEGWRLTPRGLLVQNSILAGLFSR